METTMFKNINIKEELDKEHEKQKEILQNAISILQNSSYEDEKILKNLGVKISVESSKKFEEIKDYLNLLKDGEVYSEDEVANICNTFLLEVRHISDFSKTFPIEAIGKLKKLKEEMKHREGYFVIIAPKKMFKTNSFEIPIDPMFAFVFKDSNKLFFKYIHHWGNDFSFIRKAYRYILDWKFTLITNILLISILTLMLTSIQDFDIRGLFILIPFGSIVYSMLLSLIRFLTLGYSSYCGYFNDSNFDNNISNLKWHMNREKLTKFSSIFK